eukprot:CAMPEP_0202376478 /NCGR_PEP_ID=MMETSP1127-20130417/6973_1 /ASSEMBLY_ACC=CAM_ASM_000462 /TAXON_ID=3047 /ORGANISM="Dunaliella tertiolecta, Strain CCMP1320" /LENGTH=74 /DNA_ID=CAMNT_0048974279 /DNA_START=201 /DNA_END=425 /DNA_ORIENTATION=-
MRVGGNHGKACAGLLPARAHCSCDVHGRVVGDGGIHVEVILLRAAHADAQVKLVDGAIPELLVHAWDHPGVLGK